MAATDLASGPLPFIAPIHLNLHTDENTNELFITMNGG